MRPCQHAEDLRRQRAQQVLDARIPRGGTQLDLRQSFLRRSFLNCAKLNHLRVLHDA